MGVRAETSGSLSYFLIWFDFLIAFLLIKLVPISFDVRDVLEKNKTGRHDAVREVSSWRV